EDGLAGMRETVAVLRRPYFLTMLAEAHGVGGDVRAGLAALDEAFAVMEQTDERWWEAEQHRLRGELFMQAGDRDNATASFQTALAVAQRQQARSLELRAATSLAQLQEARRQ